ncbi:hypothetical protein [Parafrankia sp. EUN1f]|uniref:hypothetical protein n=1 Tax=Parafrankia sp. EUN1f TaxID=102897 RepID=UPI0012FCC92E|nr:hypothetical protein [Parafrankia sp. EUN1f]
MARLEPDGQWPLWMAPGNPDTDRSGYGGIASYVTPRVLEERFVPPGLRTQLASRTGLRGAALDRLTVEQLWQALVDRRIGYAQPPWHPAQGQRIRDCEWLLRRAEQGSGTCVDLSLLFAGACLNERLDTYLLMLGGRERSHVAVAVRLGASAAGNDQEAELRVREPMLPPGVTDTAVAGVLAIRDRPELLAAVEDGDRDGDGDVLLIDVTMATRDKAEPSLAAAERRARAELVGSAYQLAHLVDVAVRQHGCGDEPLVAPTRRGALHGRIAPHRRAPFPFAAHVEARAAIRVGTGKVVIQGPRGVGKSVLGRSIALLADNGYGWFLNASSKTTFQTTLAEAELIERGEEPRELEAPDREALARDALDRLRRSADSWVIVLDNADAGAEPFDDARIAIDRLPSPRAGQLIVATSTAAADKWPGWTLVTLPTVTADELAEAGPPLAARLSVGRPLLMTAFTSLLDVDPAAGDDLLGGGAAGDVTGDAAGEENLNDEEAARRAAALYWCAARGSLARLPGGDALIDCAERTAWLPPDRIEPAGAGGADEALPMLAARGLLSASASAGVFALHRLFGDAIRAAVTADGRAQPSVRSLLADGEARGSLLRHGDAEVTSHLATALAGADDGLALWALGTLQEVWQDDASAATFGRAAAVLDPADPTQAGALADCLHAGARAVSRRKPEDSSPSEVAAAIADMKEAIGLRAEKDVVEIARHQAQLALLRQRAAGYLTDRAAKLVELREVMGLLEESWRSRRAVLTESELLVDRAYFNRAGIRVTLAQEDRANAAEYLRVAREVYETTAAFRMRYFRGPNPITAAAMNGIGIVGYYEVLFDLTTEPDAVLDEAFAAVNEALAMRRQTSIAGDIAKSAGLLVKLGLLQAVFATAGKDPGRRTGRDLATGQAPAEVGDAVRELGKRVEALGTLGMTPQRLREAGLTLEQIRALDLEPPAQ